MQERETSDYGHYPQQPTPRYAPQYAMPPQPKRRRRWITPVASIASLLIGIAIGAAGHSNTISTATGPSPLVTAGSETAPISGRTPAVSAKAAAPAKAGTALTLTGNSGEKLTVTLVKVVDPATDTNQFERPDTGKRYVAVQIRITNAAAAAYSDSPTNGVVLVDAAGQQYRETFADTTAGQDFNGTVNLTPGASALGVIVFEVPTSERPAQFQFTPDSGFADHTGQWKLG